MRTLQLMTCGLAIVSLIDVFQFRGWAGRNLTALQPSPPPSKRMHVELSSVKPSLFFHMGPPKTATTTLQTDLTSFLNPLKKDGIAYLGRYYRPYVNSKGNFLINRSGSDVEKAAHDMLHHERHCSEVGPGCMDDLKETLEVYRKAGTNVLLSDEAYAKQWNTPGKFQAMKDALSDEWNVVLIIGYRHFYDWMPSALYQFYRMDYGNTGRKTLWPGKGSRGRETKTAFPELIYSWPEESQQHTSSILARNEGVLPVIIFDLHQMEAGASVRTHFLCNAIPNASWSCQKSRKLDQIKRSTVMNTQEPDNEKHIFYDMVTTGAAKVGLIDTDNFERKSVREAMGAYNMNVLNQSAMDLDLACPDDEQRNYFLELSLDNQRKVYDNLTGSMEASHRDGFKSRVESKAFCWVDTDTVLRRKEWKSFFVQYSSATVATAVS